MANVQTSKYNSRASSKLLWQWNGTDITQFGNGSGAPDNTYGTPDGTLSVGAVPTSGIDVPSGDVLLYTPGTATNAIAHFLINDLPGSMPERFIMKARLGPKETTTRPLLVCAEQDELHHMSVGWGGFAGLHVLFGNNADGVITNGHYLYDANLVQRTAGVVLEVECMLVEPDTGVDPRINAMPVIVGMWGIQGYGKGGGSWSTFGSTSAIYDSSWQSGGTIRQPGIAFTCEGTAGTSWIGELQIFSHPWG